MKSKVIKRINYLVIHMTWSENSGFLYCIVEDKDNNIAIQVIQFDYMNKSCYFAIHDELPIKGVNHISLFKHENDEEAFLLSGNLPKIYKDKDNVIELFAYSDYTYLVKETSDKNTFFVFVKEIYLILILKINTEENRTKQKYFLENLEERGLNAAQKALLEYHINTMNNKLVVVNVFGLANTTEILQVQLDMNKTLILINSSDRYLRLYKYDFDTITLIKDYFDSVNKKKWINSYFYKFKIRSNYQDVIVSAFSDVNSLEFVFIDINTGNFIKRLEPFKFQCNDFVCHYNNHYSIIMISSKKLFHLYGYLVNHWSALAPKFRYIEENIEYVEEETFYDTFNQMLKKSNSTKLVDPETVHSIFYPKQVMKDNIYFCYKAEEDNIAIQSQKDLKDIFHQMNEILEIKK
jgi:hypothetical protein